MANYYADYTAFPSASSSTGQAAIASATSGIHPSGLYLSNGVIWQFVGKVPTQELIAASDPDIMGKNVSVKVMKDYVSSIGGAPPSYVHDQAIASASWSVNHGLGFHPNVSVVDSSDRKVMAEDVQHVDTNNLTINFASAFAGKAYLS